jgi:hypothetical protein
VASRQRERLYAGIFLLALGALGVAVAVAWPALGSSGQGAPGLLHPSRARLMVCIRGLEGRGSTPPPFVGA